MMKSIQINLFGIPVIHLNGGNELEFRTRKVQALLFLLAADPNPYLREQVLKLLWPGLPEKSGRSNLRQIVYYLRQSIPHVLAHDDGTEIDLIVATRQDMRLNPKAKIGVDVLHFETLLNDSQAHAHADIFHCATCQANLEEAVSLYRGHFLHDFYLDDSDEFESWAHNKRLYFRHRVLDALSLLSTMAMRQYEFGKAQALIDQQLSIDSLRESAYRQAMEIAVLSGHKEKAKIIYKQCRQLLQDEMGMQPAKRTTKLYESLVRDDRVHIDQLPVPEVRGYRLKEQIGAGAYGTVHRAIQTAVSREVAIKVIHHQYADNPEFIRRFEAEAQMVARLEHPHIVPLYDYWREPQGAYLIMRFIQGGSLLDRLSEGAWDVLRTADLLDQIAGALQTAHQQGVVHRDIKPGNILLDQDGNGYLADFGIAKDLNRPQPLTGQRGIAVGTLDYAPPEQITGDDITSRADIYSLGAVVYEMLTGERPFADASISELIHSQLNEPIPLVTASHPDISPYIDEVLQQATAKRPEERYRSTLEMAQAFRQAAQFGKSANRPDLTAGLPVASPADIYNPFKGLYAFQESDKDDFFGRDTLVRQLVSRLGQRQDRPDPRFLALVGPSGSGKSSVIKAGLLPALRNGALPGSEDWFVTEMVPGLDPFGELELAMWRVAVDPPANLVEPMRRDTSGILRTIRRILPKGGGYPYGNGQLLLVIDQFEEFFTLVSDKKEREFFLDSLLVALNAPNSPLRVVITLRADFYDRPLQHATWGPLLRENTEIILPLNRTELTWAIREPLRRLGVRLDDDLITAIITDVTDQPGSLPLLQYALTELFKQQEDRFIPYSAYDQIGGVQGALGRRAASVYGDLSDELKLTSRQVFLRLITLGEGVEDTRRRVLRSELEGLTKEAAAENDQTSPAIAHILQTFGAARFLTFDRDPQTRAPTIEVAHEALIREWGDLRQWITGARHDIRMQRLLANAIEPWKLANRDESYLLSGLRLTEFAAWYERSQVVLIDEEVAFLQAGIEARETGLAAEEARRARELETAQQLAETEHKRAEEQALAASSLRQRAIYLGAAALAAVILAVLVGVFGQRANRNAVFAQESAATAVAAGEAADEERNAALVAQATSEAARHETGEQRDFAIAAQATAQAEALIRATSEAIAEQEREAAEVKAQEAAVAYSISLIAGARQALAEDDTDLALLLALTANNVEHAPLEAYDALVDIAYAPAAREQIVFTDTLPSLIQPVNQGLWLLVGFENGQIELLDVQSRQILKVFAGHEGEVRSIALSSDESHFMSGDQYGTLIYWDIEAGESRQQFSGQPSSVESISILPGDRQALITAGESLFPSELITLDLVTGQMASRFGRDLAENREQIWSLALVDKGQQAITGGERSRRGNRSPIILWDIEQQTILNTLDIDQSSINSIDVSPDEKQALLGSDNGNLYLIELSSWRVIRQMQGHVGRVNHAVFSEDGKTAVSGGQDDLVIWWDIESGRSLLKFKGHTADVLQTWFLNPEQIISYAADGYVRIWDLHSNWELDRWNLPQVSDFSAGLADTSHYVLDIVMHPQGESLFLSTTDGNVIEVDYESGELSYLLQYHDRWATSLAADSAGEILVAGMIDGSVFYWDLQTNQISFLPAQHLGAILDVAISDNGQHIITASIDGQLFYWDLQSKQVLAKMAGHGTGDILTEVMFWGDDEIAISSSSDGSMIFWDLVAGEQIKRLTGIDAPLGGDLPAESLPGIYDIALSPNDRFLLSSGSDQRLHLWDIETGESVRRYQDDVGNIYHVEISPDGRLALATTEQQTFVVWDIESGAVIRHYQANQGSTEVAGLLIPSRLAVHPNGETAVTADALESAIIKWRLETPSLVELVAWMPDNRLLRELTCLERTTYQIEPLCVAGISSGTTDDLINNLQSPVQQSDNVTNDLISRFDFDIDRGVSSQVVQDVRFGENRGELVRHQWDVWRFEAQAGELFSLKMVADNGLNGDQGEISIYDRYERGVLDTILLIFDADGRLLFRSDDSDHLLLSSTDAVINRFLAPEDGIYYIQARSKLDDHAGGYTLVFDKVEVSDVDPLGLDSLTGQYLERPHMLNIKLYVEDGQLKGLFSGGGFIYELRQVSNNEFVWQGEGSVSVFTYDEEGEVDGYELLFTPIFTAESVRVVGRAEKID